MRLRIASLASLLTAVGLVGLAAPTPAPAAGSSGQAGAPPTATTPTATTPAAPPLRTTPVPVPGAVRLFLPDAFFVHGSAVTVPGRALSFQGRVTPYVAGQWVTVRAYLGRRLVKSGRLRVKPSPGGHAGLFTERVRSPGPGILRVQVRHAPTPQMRGFSGRRAVAVLGASAGFGSRGTFVALIQQRLNAVHVWVPETGVYDAHTGLALDAYHRLLGWGFSQNLDGRTISALLDGRGTFAVRHPHDGKHVEGNLGRQLLAEIYGSRVYRIYPISSGKALTPTILGHFHVYLRTPGYLPDGMYYSSFFVGGYAIHGYDPAPDYAASHGCMRVPIVDAISIYNWLALGDVVDVYR
ncbi:MAG TPA: L,D-transpeptidase [Solirubrobacteraceae bacterium]